MVAKRMGVVDSVDSSRIVVRVDADHPTGDDDVGVDIYRLTKFTRSNHNTCINQRPIVEVEKVTVGHVLADGLY